MPPAGVDNHAATLEKERMKTDCTLPKTWTKKMEALVAGAFDYDDVEIVAMKSRRLPTRPSLRRNNSLRPKKPAANARAWT